MVEEIGEKKSERGLIDVLRLNFPVAIQSTRSQPMQVTGVYGFVNVTLIYRLEFGSDNSTFGDECVLIRPTFATVMSEYVQGHTTEEEELMENPADTLGENSPVDVYNLSELYEKPATSTRKCLSKNDAIKLVVYFIFMTSLVLCVSLTVTYILVNLCCTRLTVSEREMILEKFLEEGM